MIAWGEGVVKKIVDRGWGSVVGWLGIDVPGEEVSRNGMVEN